MQKVIIFSGRAQAGKDTAAEFTKRWLEQRGYCGVSHVACAGYLKEVCQHIFGIPKEDLWGDAAAKDKLTQVHVDALPTAPLHLGKIHSTGYLSIRQLLQYVGSDIFRQMYPDCWANYARNLIIEKNYTVALITDARFPNEIDIFQNDPRFTTILIRLQRNPLAMTHKSETALDNYQPSDSLSVFTLDNSNMSIDEKNERLGKILQLLEQEYD